MAKFSPSIPRRMFWSHEIEDAAVCPRCGAALETEMQTFMAFVRIAGEPQAAVLEAEASFCPACPVVVLDFEALSETVSDMVDTDQALEFAVAGVIDTDAIPADKADVPLGEDDNPLPLVQFLGPEEPGGHRKGGKRHKRSKRKK